MAPDIQGQLAGGMLPHLNSYLQVRGLQGQLSGCNVELVSLGAAVPGQQQLEEIQMELMRLASLQRTEARSNRSLSIDRVPKGKRLAVSPLLLEDASCGRLTVANPNAAICKLPPESLEAKSGRQAPVQAGRAASSSREPMVVDSLELGSEIHKQLAAGMLYHLNRFLRHHGLQGRLRTSFQLELLSLGVHAPPHLEEVEMELLRLASLRQELIEPWHWLSSLYSMNPAKDRIPVSQPMVKRLIGPQGHICRMLSRDLGVQVGGDRRFPKPVGPNH